MKYIRLERAYRALAICFASICGTMLMMIPSGVTYLLSAGCMLCVVLCVWQVAQPDAWFQKQIEDDAAFENRHRVMINGLRVVAIISVIALIVYEIINKV